MKLQFQRHAALAGERSWSQADGRQSWENKRELIYSISSSTIYGGQEKAEPTDADRQTNPLISKDLPPRKRMVQIPHSGALPRDRQSRKKVPPSQFKIITTYKAVIKASQLRNPRESNGWILVHLAGMRQSTELRSWGMKATIHSPAATKPGLLALSRPISSERKEWQWPCC